ncbi:MAG TPA: hypothetical protein VGM14_18515 [Streptosporangiaceae bacterium]
MTSAAAGSVAALVGVGVVNAGVALGDHVAPRMPASSWGRAIEMPGPSVLGVGKAADVNAVSCASTGNCTAGGDYLDRFGHEQGFVASEVHGVWGKATKVPGLQALNAGGDAEILALACALAGNCAATGTYTERLGQEQAFVASEWHGVWGKAIEIPGLAVLNKGGGIVSLAISCGSPDDCAVGGMYQNSPNERQAFVASERTGRWDKAIEVPGVGALGPDVGESGVESVSCAAAGDCTATGTYLTGIDRQHGFAVSERNGVWGKAIEIPGLGRLDSGGFANVGSVSCASPGNCAASGYYGHRGFHGFVVSERDGVWGKAIMVPRVAEVSSVACAAPGDCAGVGTSSGQHLGFAVSERNGVWGKVVPIPGLNRRGQFFISSIACVSAGNCAAGGFYDNSLAFDSPAFVVSERHGVWTKAIRVPGLFPRNAQVLSLSCSRQGYCAAGGGYLNRAGNAFGFVVTERHDP